MRALKLGHAVLKVRSLDVSVPYYRDALGLTEVARHGSRMVFLSCGDNHHDLALLEIGAYAPLPECRQVGLYHLAFKVGDTLSKARGGDIARSIATTSNAAMGKKTPFYVSIFLIRDDSI